MNCFAAKRRQKVAQGVSPGKTYRGIEQPPEGVAEYVALSGFFVAINSDPGLTPWATVVDAVSRLDWQTGQFVHSFIDRRYSWRVNAVSGSSAVDDDSHPAFCAGADNSRSRSRGPTQASISYGYRFLTEANTATTAFRCVHRQSGITDGCGLHILDDRT